MYFLWIHFALQTLAEGRPQMNVLRQKRKPPPIDASILATMQLVPKLGAVKARALLERFKSKLFWKECSGELRNKSIYI